MPAVRMLAGLAAALALAVPGAAQNTSNFKTGGWTGYAQFDQQRFQYCIVYRAGNDGLEYGIRTTAQLGMFVGVSNKAWNMEPSSGYEFTIEVGSYRKDHRGTVTADRRNTLWLDVGNDADLRRAIAAGGTMNLIGKGSARFSLALLGSDNAMRKLLACTALYGVE